jgi:nitrite reductase/ring-hydroxylating ferredoxin subunit/alkylhydroperoxidase/carboxymuconolactone decarboxylase family protein YurZ
VSTGPDENADENAVEKAVEKADEDLSGLQWLSRHRPQAMEHLMAFFRESGQHLDPKTRFLISVVTKVVNFTPRGLRQYIPRAMREGASRDEILDAILCAYPAAGLTKVVDAIDILRSIPDPSPAPSSHESDDVAPDSSAAAGSAWHRVAAFEDLSEGRGHIVTVDGRRVALFRVGQVVHATSNACIHLGGELGDGYLSGTTVTCPLHGWDFDVSDGRCLTHEREGIEVYPTQIQDGEVRVLL